MNIYLVNTATKIFCDNLFRKIIGMKHIMRKTPTSYVWHYILLTTLNLYSLSEARAQSLTWAYQFPYDGEVSVGSWAQVKSFSENKTNSYWGGTACVWTTTEPSSPIDTHGEWGGGCSGTFWVSSVNIISASIALPEFKVNFRLNGPSYLAPANATIKLIGENSSPIVYQNQLAAGPQQATISKTTIPKGSYSQMQIFWFASPLPITSTFPITPKLEVLGNIEYTQYNVPIESACTGKGSNVYIVENLTQCPSYTAELANKFISQVQLNGAGQSTGHGLIKVAAATGVFKYCAGKLPPDATSDNTFLKVSTITGSCNTPLIPFQSAAVTDSMRKGTLPCNSNIELINPDQSVFGGRTVVDRCPGCKNVSSGADGHIDSFTDSQACSGHEVGSIGTKWTYKR